MSARSRFRREEKLRRAAWAKEHVIARLDRRRSIRPSVIIACVLLAGTVIVALAVVLPRLAEG